MSDAFSGIEAAVSAAVAADPGAFIEGAPAATPVAPVVAAPVGEPAPDPDLFPREYVEQLRRENADYRTRMNEYLELARPLLGFEDERDIQAAHALIEALGDPDEFAGLLDQLEALPPYAEARARRRSQPQQVAPQPQPQPFDPRAVEQIVEQRIAAFQAQQAQERLQAEIVAEARSLGYNPDADMAADVAGALAFQNLLVVAQNVTGGDIAKAHALISGQQAQQAAAMVAARPAPGVLPTVPGQPPAQGIDMSKYTGKGALDQLDKDLKVMVREGRL